MGFQIPADPHPWPRPGRKDPSACAVMVVDMQHDYCTPGFYLDQAGYDTARLREPVPRIARLLRAARRAGLHVVYTQHGRPLGRSRTASGRESPNSAFPMTAARGETGWEIVPALQPLLTDTVIQKTTINGFASGELHRHLTSAGVRHIAFCGNTIDVCVHSTLRAAVDLGYDCLLLADCCAAVNDGLHRWAIESVKVENGVFGAVATAAALVRALRPSEASP